MGRELSGVNFCQGGSCKGLQLFGPLLLVKEVHVCMDLGVFRARGLHLHPTTNVLPIRFLRFKQLSSNCNLTSGLCVQQRCSNLYIYAYTPLLRFRAISHHTRAGWEKLSMVTGE